MDGHRLVITGLVRLCGMRTDKEHKNNGDSKTCKIKDCPENCSSTVIYNCFMTISAYNKRINNLKGHFGGDFNETKKYLDNLIINHGIIMQYINKK
jgi:hypothetical protein